jgi:diguanylate cyclase (GGDEF)-like protein
MIRLLICDDSPEARRMLRAVLAADPEIAIVGEAADGSEALALAVELSPDVVLMDVSMPVLDGVEATRRLRQLLPTTRIVAFAGSDDLEVVGAMLDAGASAYCVKGAPLWELERAIAGASEPLVRLAHSLNRSLPGGLGHLLAREVAELGAALCAATYLTSSDAGLSLAGLAGAPSQERLASPPGVVLRAFTEATAAFADAHELAELYRLGVPCGEALAVPLVADGARMGALLVAMPANVQVEIDTELVGAAADLAAAALGQERKLALTYAEARRDALTGLPNRRAFDEQLAAELHQRSPDDDIALALFDVDRFKEVNDSAGHAAGDEVLSTLARILLRNVRTDEHVFRIGGDEFALLVNNGEAGAVRAAERIRRAIDRQQRGRPLPQVSAGVASLGVADATKEALLERADAALYAAKERRNGVVVCDATTPVKSGTKAPVLAPAKPVAEERAAPADRFRLLVVDDDPNLLILLRTTFEIIDIVIEEARNAIEAEAAIAHRRPDAIVLDVRLPGVDGISFCSALKADPATSAIPVVILSADTTTEAAAKRAGADAFLRKPFSPLELLATVEQLAGGLFEGPFGGSAEEPPEEQLLLYAHDLRRLLELERGQRVLLKSAYEITVSAFAGALEAKDFGTGAHSKRVVRYARELAKTFDPALLDDPSLEYGFLLHDIGKLAIPDWILQKPGRLTKEERRVIRTHTLVGAQLLGEVPLLQGRGLGVIRSHHERWDGSGYPDLLAGETIPIGGRIFAVADTLDAMTSDRPYRDALPWETAIAEITLQRGRQFDPDVVDVFQECESKLRALREELVLTAV